MEDYLSQFMPFNKPPHLRAVIRFLTEQEGGRLTDPQPGVRPQLKIGDFYTSCIINPIHDVATFERGKEIEVTVTPVFHDYEQVKDGLAMLRDIELYEGSHKVGDGKFMECRAGG